MSISNLSDFKIYDEQFQSGVIEHLTQAAALFNEGSSGCLQMITDDMLGFYQKEAFWKQIGTGIISRQDVTTNASVTPHKLEQLEKIDVKLFRKIEPTDVTYNSFAEIGGDADGDASFILGQMSGEAMVREMLNTTLKALVAAVPSSLTKDATADTVKNIAHSNILDALALFGDNSSRIKAFVMHSKQWFDLQKQGLADGYEAIATGILNVNYVPAFNRPVVVSDSSALVNAGVYSVLGLTDSAAVVSRIGDTKMASQQILGNEQLALRFQGEYRYNLGLKGFAYDITSGSNPNDAAIGTQANWDKCVTSDYDTAGVLIKCNAKP